MAFGAATRVYCGVAFPGPRRTRRGLSSHKNSAVFELPDDEAAVRAATQRYAAQQWLALAGAAWRSYLAHGRGAFIVPWSAVIGQGRPRLVYVASLEPLASIVDTYNPQSSVVFAFVGDSALAHLQANRPGRVTFDGVRAYWFAATLMPAPPAAARALA